MQIRLTGHRPRSSGLTLEASKVGSKISQSDCSSPHARPISLDLKISSLVGRAIVTSPAIPLTAKRGTVLAGVPRSLDGFVGSAHPTSVNSQLSTLNSFPNSQLLKRFSMLRSDLISRLVWQVRHQRIDRSHQRHLQLAESLMGKLLVSESSLAR
jgi:hypothetical protein